MATTTPSRSSGPGANVPTTLSEPVVSTLDTTNLRHGSVFEKERERLISEISQGIESLLSNSNALNRKLEESISVGKEFEPIAGLWGRFTELMTLSGIPDPYADRHAAQAGRKKGEATDSAAAASAKGQPCDEEPADGHTDNQLRESSTPGKNLRRSIQAGEEKRDLLRASTNEQQSLPPGVAPGGGTIYGQES